MHEALLLNIIICISIIIVNNIWTINLWKKAHSSTVLSQEQ